jgi:O-antigen/teichoic acid export membrane protein
VYSRASNLATLIFTNLFGTATAVIFSQLSKTFRETGVLRDAFLRGLEIILALMWPLLMGLAVLARPVIRLLYGAKWDAAALPLSLLMIAQFIVLSFGMNWELFVLRDQTAQQTKYEIARSCCGLVFFSMGCMFSLGGAAIGRVAEAVVGALVYLPKMPSMAGATRSDFTSIYFKSICLTVAAVGPSALVMTANHWSATPSLPAVAIGVATGVFLWIGALAYFDHPLLDEIKAFLLLLRREVVGSRS